MFQSCCVHSFRQIWYCCVLCSGGDPLNVQVGQVVIPTNSNPAICSDPACQVSSSQGDANCDEETPDADVLRTFYDGAESTTQFFSVTNVKIVTDDSDSFSGDKARMARQ